jgi:hypothetical protein
MKMKSEAIYEYLKEKSPEAILYDNCDSALIGTARLYREEQWVEVAIYSYESLVEHFKTEFLKDEEEKPSEDDAEVDAMEWVDYNIAGGYLGIYTPLIIND